MQRGGPASDVQGTAAPGEEEALGPIFFMDFIFIGQVVTYGDDVEITGFDDGFHGLGHRRLHTHLPVLRVPGGMVFKILSIFGQLAHQGIHALVGDADKALGASFGAARIPIDLDEAIGELQKVCHAVEHGFAFSQPIQAYTWLAQCLVDKGAPEAAVRWYQKALQLPGLDSGSRCSIYYDLGAAYQAAGDNKSALTNFMEVYGSNIDFRDVASRIKTLKA